MSMDIFCWFYVYWLVLVEEIKINMIKGIICNNLVKLIEGLLLFKINNFVIGIYRELYFLCL